MNKRYLANKYLISVLAFGLMSCSPDKENKDNYRSPPPVIVVDGVDIPQNEFDKQTNKDVDLRDQLDVSGGHPQSIRVISDCELNKKKFFRNESFHGNLFLFLQLLPFDVLSENLRAGNMRCNLKIFLYNEEGSDHEFDLLAIRITDKSDANLYLAADGQHPIEFMNQLSSVDFGKLILRFDTKNSAQAELLCADVLFDPWNFQDGMDMSLFDLQNFTIKSEQHQTLFDQKRIQTCRVAVIEENMIQAISSLFRLIIPQSELEVELKQEPIVKYPEINVLAQITIKNSEAYERYIRISKEPLRVESWVLAKINNIGRPEKRIARKSAGFPISVANGELLTELEHFLVVKVPPEGEVVLEIKYLTGFRHPYGRAKTHFAARSTLLTPISIQEVDNQAQVLNELPIPEIRPIEKGKMP